MQCPLLAEARVTQCRTASASRAVPMGAAARQPSDRCHSPEHAQCAMFPSGEAAGGAVCPCLEERTMLYCTGAPAAKYIPYSDTSQSRCGDGRHRYCDVYLGVCGRARRGPMVRGVLVPDGLLFTANHFWFDPGEDNVWHIGIDGLLATVLAGVEQITFLSGGGARPAAVVRARGLDLTLTFPLPLAGAEPHLYLRANPQRLVEDPYQRGWLFEGRSPAPEGMVGGAEAVRWMDQECERLSRWTHDRVAEREPELANDGGEFAADLTAHLQRAGILALHQEFFSPFLKWEAVR